MAKMSSQACTPWLLSMTRVPPSSHASNIVDAKQLVELLVLVVLGCELERKVLEEIDARGGALNIDRRNRLDAEPRACGSLISCILHVMVAILTKRNT